MVEAGNLNPGSCLRTHDLITALKSLLNYKDEESLPSMHAFLTPLSKEPILNSKSI